MVAVQGDRTIELPDLTTMADKKTTFIFERNRPALAASTDLVSRGEKLGSAGKYEDALGLFREAAKADPFNPQPRYEAGITLLLLERYPQAVEEFEVTKSLAPGWFNVDSDLWIAQELLAGRLGHEIFLVTWAAENTKLEPLKKLEMIDAGIARKPDFPYLHLQRGVALAALNRKEEAVAAIDAGLAAKGEPGIRSRLLAQCATLSDLTNQQHYLREILQISGANMMSRTMAEVVLKCAEKND